MQLTKPGSVIFDAARYKTALYTLSALQQVR